MKKKFIRITALMLCTLVLFSSCTNESTYSESTKNSSALAKKNVDDPKEQQKKLAELAYGLDQVYSLATQKIRATDTPNVVEILKESYTAIYKEYADEATLKIGVLTIKNTLKMQKKARLLRK